MRNVPKAAILLGTAAVLFTAGLAAAGSTAPGWPSYLAMGAIGGPAINDNFSGKPVDVVFKYAGVNGDGDPGRIDPPSNVLRMTPELQVHANTNGRGMRVAIVEYTAQMSGGLNFWDFTNKVFDQNAQPAPPPGSYFMARHFITLGADAQAMNDKPIVYNGKSNYGTLIMSPDLLGAIQQNNYLAGVNAKLQESGNDVNLAVDQALCFLTKSRSYFNSFGPNGRNGQPYIDKNYTGTPVAILEQMLDDGYPAYSIEGQTDPYWNVAINNAINGDSSQGYSQIGVWFNQCVTSPTYDTVAYPRPTFPATFDGWIQANNWIIRSMSPKGHVTFGWQENMWTVTSGFWMHQDFVNDAAIAANYSTPVGNWLQANAPSVITTGPLGTNYVPDYFVFDRYEVDDSADPGQATLYSARSWDNYLTGVGLISKRFNNIPLMLWQIPGGHIPYVGEAQPETVLGSYIFSTAPVYFFGDSNLQANLSNIVAGPSSTTPGTAVGNLQVNCTTYNCGSNTTYKQYLLYYKGQANNYNWASGNGRLAFAASNNVFSILWGGGNTTNVIKNFSNPDDHGWLANKIINYYQNPTPLTPAPVTAAVAHDLNGDSKSDILWRSTAGDLSLWLMNGVTALSVSNLGNVGSTWSVVAQRDFNGDGKSDILWRDSSGNISMWLMSGTTASSVVSLGNIGAVWSVAATADFNGDGKGDILWRDSSGNVAMWLMNGATVTSVTGLGNTGSGWTVAGTADFNGDGKADILWRDTSGNVAMWLMNGAAVTSVTGLGNIGASWTVAGTADFNGDGKGDVLWRNTAGDMAVWLMNGTTVSSVTGLGNVASNWMVASNGDYNGDGKGDVLWRSAAGDISLWLMNGTVASQVTNLGNVPTNWSIQNANAN